MPVDLGGYVADIGACIGIAMFPVDGGDGRALLKNAATALSVAKSGQRGSFRRFETWMDQSAVERRALERDLRLAIEADQITVFFQPQFATDTLRVTGFEALARWRHPERGFVPPGVFIPLAEECGLILRIGRAVLERACAEAALWRPPLRVAVNLSPVQFLDANLLSWLSGVLERIGLPASRLELEVTEGVLIKDEDSALGALRELKALGVELALDDFGTGYSGLSYLRRFPFDVLKIDKTFVVAQQWDFSTRAIVDAVLTMSIRMGLRVVAEGIETEEQLALLRDQGASDVQGFLLARPMPGKEVQPFLDSVAARAEQATASPGMTHDGATKPRPAGHGAARRGADDPTEAQPLAPAAEAAPTVTGGRRRRRSAR
jgi:EAL domain-containing protein (putative c-di-GMP-specific phosphodiesterase class I)